MELIKQSALLVCYTPDSAQQIEAFGRTCYKTEDKITPDSSKGFVARIMKSGHESVIEHLGATVRFITDRGVTHELVRHRLAAYSQESTRYVDYQGKPMQFILPVWMEDEWLGEWDVEKINQLMKDISHQSEYIFIRSCERACYDYNLLRKQGWKPQQARGVLPNALKTEIVTTFNIRMWRHVIKQRTGKDCHPQIRPLMQMAARQLKDAMPEFFSDLPGICFSD